MGHFVIFFKTDCGALTGRTSTRKCRQLKSQNYFFVFFFLCFFFVLFFNFFAFCRRCWPCQQCERERSLCVKSHILIIPYWKSFDVFFQKGIAEPQFSQQHDKLWKKNPESGKTGHFLTVTRYWKGRRNYTMSYVVVSWYFSPRFLSSPFLTIGSCIVSGHPSSYGCKREVAKHQRSVIVRRA